MGSREEEVLKALSNPVGLNMFKLIGTATLTGGDAEITSHSFLTQTNVTRKQFYSNMSKLVNKTGLISRKHGRYALSNYGKVVFYSLNIMNKGAKHFWALKALDNDEFSNDIPPEQILEISARLIEDKDILKIVSDL
jgi:hypothetical protein